MVLPAMGVVSEIIPCFARRPVFGYDSMAYAILAIASVGFLVWGHHMRSKGIDYFENSRRATLVQREYAIRNPQHFRHYCQNCWGWTACDGPGPRQVTVDGRRRRLLGYAARGAPYGPDDGTVAPWASVASLPFAPDVVIPTMQHIDRLMREYDRYMSTTTAGYARKRAGRVRSRAGRWRRSRRSSMREPQDAPPASS